MTTTTGIFRYLDPVTIGPDKPKPWAKVDTGAAQSFTQLERRRSVTDLRSVPASASTADFGTDVSGFALHHAPLPPDSEIDFFDDASVRARYYPAVEALVRARLPDGQKVSRVLIFDHTVRRHDPSSPRQPVQAVHVDQTPGAAAARVRRHVESAEEADRLLQGRYQIVNVWRPIGHAATDFPLALVDWRTTAPEDLVAVDLLYPVRRQQQAETGGDGDGDDDDRGKEVLPDPASITSTAGYEVKGETYSVAPSDRHKFYYVKDMTPDEALFIKCFDSRGAWAPDGTDGVAALTPHTAFIDPATPPGTKGRQSIEVRCLVFYD